MEKISSTSTKWGTIIKSPQVSSPLKTNINISILEVGIHYSKNNEQKEINEKTFHRNSQKKVDKETCNFTLELYIYIFGLREYPK